MPCFSPRSPFSCFKPQVSSGWASAPTVVMGPGGREGGRGGHPNRLNTAEILINGFLVVCQEPRLMLPPPCSRITTVVFYGVLLLTAITGLIRHTETHGGSLMRRTIRCIHLLDSVTKKTVLSVPKRFVVLLQKLFIPNRQKFLRQTKRFF